MLEAGGGSAAGAHIFVFTDGIENEDPRISAMTAEVLQKKVCVHGLLMSQVADNHPLIQLAQQSGCGYCIYEDSGDNGQDYYQCLTDSIRKIGVTAPVEVSHHCMITAMC